ncbi:MAG: dihydrodipicolinate reductase [Armatimonadota bacterium]
MTKEAVVKETIAVRADTSQPDAPIRVVLCGLGPIGIQSGKLAACKDGIEVVGAVEIRQDLVGRPLSDVLSDAAVAGQITDDLGGCLSAAAPDVVLHTTSSHVPDVRDQLRTIVSAGVNVVSSTEELLYPHLHNSNISGELDALARQHDATIIGTGVNPGFVMDLLPVVLSGVCQKVERVEVTRVVDAAKRRAPLQEKVGAGISPEEFERRAQAGRIGHVGLVESMAFVASAFGWEIDRFEDELEPVIADRVTESDHFRVQPGEVAGIRETGRAYMGEYECISLRLEMYLGAPHPRDAVRIFGAPPINLQIAGGIHGDLATCAALVNAIPGALAAPPGLLTLRDVAPARAFCARSVILKAD